MSYIFIHGLGQSRSSWDKVISILSDRVDCPELPELLGPGGASYQNLYNGLEQFCENAEQPMHLCGISLGAVLAMDYTIRHSARIRSLVLIAPQYHMPRRLLKLQNLLFRLLPEKSFRQTGVGREDLISLTNSMMDLKFESLLSNITCKTLILCGEKDRANKSAARALSKKLSNAEVRMIRKAGHEVNLEAPEDLAEILKNFYQSLEHEISAV